MAAVFRWKEKEKQTLELLFVRRSISERDIWSGQIAFPGGKRQRKNSHSVPVPVHSHSLSAAADSSSSATTSAANKENESARWETPLETAKRETMEEIGLDLNHP